MNSVQKIAKKFEGIPKLAKAIGKNRTTVWRWTQPRKKGGTNGAFPDIETCKLVLNAARENNIELSLEDFFE